MFSQRFKGFSRVFLAFSLLLIVPAQGHAAGAPSASEQAEASGRIQKLNRYAMQLFDDMEFALAEKTLLEALGETQKAGLSNGKEMLMTHGNLAILYSVGIKDSSKAVSHFRKALAIKPDLKLSKQRTAPETEANFNRAKSEIASGTKDTAPATPTKAAPAVESEAAAPLKCPMGGEVGAGDEITLKCMSSGKFRPAAVILFFKPNGGDQYQSVEMAKGEPSGDATPWVGKIPGSATTGRLLPYYFEARDAKGNSLGTLGKEESPNLITVKGASAPEPSSSLAEGESDTDEDDAIDDDNPLARLEKERRREQKGSQGTFWVALGIGSGFGYANADHTEAYGRGGRSAAFNPGLAVASLGHLVPEIGYYIGRNTALTLTGRNQYMQISDKKIATGANSLLLRLLFLTEEEGDNFRYYVSIVAGGGEGFRFRVNAEVIETTGSPSRWVSDSVRGGPYVAGMGGGLVYKLNRHWRWTLDTQALVGFPYVSAVLDASTGARYEF